MYYNYFTKAGMNGKLKIGRKKQWFSNGTYRKQNTAIVPFPSIAKAAIVSTSAELYLLLLSEIHFLFPFLHLPLSLGRGVILQCLSDFSDILMF